MEEADGEGRHFFFKKWEKKYDLHMNAYVNTHLQS